MPQVSIFWPLLVLIYVNNLSNCPKSKCELFTNDIFVAHDADARDINKGLKLISDWTSQWKISFKTGHGKQAQEVIFSRSK